MPVITVCANEEEGWGNQLLSQCYYRRDQFDTLGQLVITCDGCKYMDNFPEDKCFWGCGVTRFKRYELNYGFMNWRFFFSPYYNYINGTDITHRSVRAQDDSAGWNTFVPVNHGFYSMEN